VIDTRVVAPERPYADDCDVNCVFVFQCKILSVIVMLSEGELPLAEAQGVEAIPIIVQTPGSDP
jgi:hypothetical protein